MELHIVDEPKFECDGCGRTVPLREVSYMGPPDRDESCDPVAGDIVLCRICDDSYATAAV